MLAPSFPTASALVEAPTAVGDATAIAPVVQGITPPIPITTGSAKMLAPSVSASSVIAPPPGLGSASALAPSVDANTPVAAPLATLSALALPPQLVGTVSVLPPPATANAKALIPGVVATTPVAAPVAVLSSQMLVPTLSTSSNFIEFDSVGTHGSASIGGSASLSWQHTATAGSYVLAYAFTSTDGVASATYGSKPMTVLNPTSGAANGLWLLGVDDVPGGLQTVTVNKNGTAHNSQGNSIAYTNVGSVGSVVAATGLHSAGSLAVTCPQYGMAVCVFAAQGSIIGTSGGTQRWLTSDVLDEVVLDSNESTTFTASLSAAHTYYAVGVPLSVDNA